MQDISAATGLEKGSLYSHFATKEELAVAAFDHAWAKSCSARVGNLDQTPNSVDKLKLHIENFVSTPSFSRAAVRCSIRSWIPTMVMCATPPGRACDVRLGEVILRM